MGGENECVGGQERIKRWTIRMKGLKLQKITTRGDDVSGEGGEGFNLSQLFLLE